MRRVYIVDDIERTGSKALAMADLNVRNVRQDVVDALERRAEANGRSVEADHWELLREALLGAGEEFAARAAASRQRLRASVASTDVIRAAGDGAP